MWGKELLCKGLRKRIWSGEDTSVFKDAWLPREHTFKVITPTTGDDLKASALIDTASEYWNVEKLRELMWEVDVQSVISIPICQSMAPDRWIWHYSKDGFFSTKSAYKFFSSSLYHPNCSNGDIFSKWWKCLWGLQILCLMRFYAEGK